MDFGDLQYALYSVIYISNCSQGVRAQAIYPTLVVVLVNSSRASHGADLMAPSLPSIRPGADTASAARPDPIFSTVSSFTMNANTLPEQTEKYKSSGEV